MNRPSSATLTLVLLALAPGCSPRGSAPGSAHEAADDKRADAKPQSAAEPGDASPAPAAGGEAKAAESQASRTGSPENDDALAGSRVQIAEPMISGGLDRDIIRRKAQDHETELRACHARALAGDPELAGTIAVKLSVDARGLVKDVELGADSELAEPENRELVDCILESIAGWSFAGEASGAATVELRVELSPAK